MISIFGQSLQYVAFRDTALDALSVTLKPIKERGRIQRLCSPAQVRIKTSSPRIQSAKQSPQPLTITFKIQIPKFHQPKLDNLVRQSPRRITYKKRSPSIGMNAQQLYGLDQIQNHYYA